MAVLDGATGLEAPHGAGVVGGDGQHLQGRAGVAEVRRGNGAAGRLEAFVAGHGVAFEAYERAIDAHVKNIRRKLEPDPRAPRHLLTVYGVGYRLAD